MPHKFIVIGDVGVGKTCLLTSFAYGYFPFAHEATFGIDHFERKMTIAGKEYILHLWDTAGQERFRSLIPLLYRDTTGAFLCYALDDPSSVENLPEWKKELEDHGIYNIILLGLKTDVGRELPLYALEILANLQLPEFRVCAKDGTRVEEAFTALVLSSIREEETSTPLRLRGKSYLGRCC